MAAVSLPGVVSAELGDGEACFLRIALSSSTFLRLRCQRPFGELLPQLRRHPRVLKQALLRQPVRLLGEPAGYVLEVTEVKCELAPRLVELLSDRLQFAVELEVLFGVVHRHSLGLHQGERLDPRPLQRRTSRLLHFFIRGAALRR